MHVITTIFQPGGRSEISARAEIYHVIRPLKQQDVLVSPDTLSLVKKLLRGGQDVVPTVNHMFCYDGKLRNRPCKMKNQISISAWIGLGIALTGIMQA